MELVLAVIIIFTTQWQLLHEQATKMRLTQLRQKPKIKVRECNQAHTLCVQFAITTIFNS